MIDNYMAFLAEFYDLIDEDFKAFTRTDLSSVPVCKSLSEFREVWNGDTRGNRTPFIYDTATMFSTLGCVCKEYWLFYSGGYKAYLEVYTVLQHFERILAKAMRNPLANAIKFGIFG